MQERCNSIAPTKSVVYAILVCRRKTRVYAYWMLKYDALGQLKYISMDMFVAKLAGKHG